MGADAAGHADGGAGKLGFMGGLKRPTTICRAYLAESNQFFFLVS
jgi:hypothetical protein